MGQVCAKHNEFYETRCRWCESAAPTFPAFTWMGIPVAVDPILKADEMRFVPAPPAVPAEPKPILIGGILYSPCITSFPNDGHGSLE